MTAKSEADSRLWLTLDYSPLDLEEETRRFWEKNQISKQLMQLRQKNHREVLGYVEGPPTMNGVPHIGHARGRVMKDLRYRFKATQGYYVTFRAGWDSQGLPVELEVERALRVKNKRDLLRKVGESKFIEECKKTVMKYNRVWREADLKLGVFMDYDNAYWTYLDSYIEREWQYLKRAWEQNLLGEGYYVVAYCPRCQTSLSNAEVGLGYEQVEDPSLYFKFRLAKAENEYFLVWTTMPFTLITDLMLAVHPGAEYAKVKVGKEVWVLVKNRVEPVMQELEITEYSITETLPGEKLNGVKYDYPFKDLIPCQREMDTQPLVHTVVCEDFVDTETATGIVHLAPGNGEDDFNAAQKRKVPIYVPFDDEANFTEKAGEFAGLYARHADSKVVEELRNRGLLVSVKMIRHEYPTCWRSHHKLIWMARREYFLWTEKINKKVVEAAEKVEYFFDPPKNRFLAVLREGKPWCISRERVWGAPLPIWVCEKCGEKVLIASKKELLEKAVENPDLSKFELHKPWIDQIELKCSKCEGKMKREPFVLDCWHNSGASPYASFTDEEFEKYVPVDFLVEAVDQTRGWANSLLLEHIILTGKAEAPYKAFLFCSFVLDEKGRKMSKSLGNVIEVNPLLDKHSADVSRFYLLWKCSPTEVMNFDVKELRKRPYQILSTLYHLHRFFMQNAEYDRFNPQKHTLNWAERNKALKPPDRWLLSKLQKAIKGVTEKFENCEFNVALSALEDFVVNVISRDYVPIIRRDLWSDDPETHNRRLAVYATLRQTLKTLILLFNPITPYLSEAMHQRVYRKMDKTLPKSVNFEAWPTPDGKLRNEALEQEFDTLLQAVSLVYSARQKAQLKRRWPLQEAKIVAPKKVQKALKNLEEAFLELGNVKTVKYLEELPEIDTKRWVSASNEAGAVHILLYTHRGKALLGEGLLRDLSRRIQALRKELGFMPTDILGEVHIAKLDPENTALLKPYLSEMADLVRAKKVYVHAKQSEFEYEWHKLSLDKKEVNVAIIA